MKNKFLWVCFAIGAFWAGCSDDGELNPTHIDRNRFNVADFSSPEEMEVRNHFHEKTGCYIVFTDSLAKRESVTPAGNYVFIDTLDLNYAASSRTQHVFDYTLLPTLAEREAAADFLADEVLPRIDSVWWPYSFFVVDSLKFTRRVLDGQSNEMRPTVVMGSWACYSTTIVGCNGLFEMDATEREACAREIQKGMVLGMYTELDSVDYADFYAFSTDYYANYGQLDQEYVDEEELGFLPGVWVRAYWYGRENDVAAYIYEIFSMTKQEFDEKYGKWQIVLDKRDAMEKILEGHGIKVY